jgi:hypothetical protein
LLLKVKKQPKAIPQKTKKEIRCLSGNKQANTLLFPRNGFFTPVKQNGKGEAQIAEKYGGMCISLNMVNGLIQLFIKIVPVGLIDEFGKVVQKNLFVFTAGNQLPVVTVYLKTLMYHV